MRCCRWYLLTGLGLGIAATGLIFLLAWRDIFDVLVTEEKNIQPGTALYKEWRRPTTRPIWQVYVYNWTNAQAVLGNPPQESSASFREFGPYTFEEYTEVVDVKFHPVNGTLSYRKRTYFRRNDPAGGRSDAAKPEEVTTVNLVALQAAYRTSHQNYSVQRELSFLLHNHHQRVTLTRPVDQLLFGGHREPLLEKLRKIVCAGDGASIGVPCQDERFAYFRTFNVSRRPSEMYSLDAGLKDRTRYGVVRSFGLAPERKELNPCDGFADLTGELFPSRIDRVVNIRLVLPELCRRLELVFEREQLVDGVLGYRYTLHSPYEAVTLTEEQIGRCPSTPIRLGRYGILNANECNAMPVYAPEADNAPQPYFVLEPTTGTLLESCLGATYHTLLRANEHIALLQHVPDVRVPLFRFVRIYQASPVKMAKLKQLLHLADVGHQAALAGCLVGVAIVLLAAIYGCWESRKPSSSQRDEYRIVDMQPSSGEGQTLK
uniref:Scavenger receptor class B n=1 Tax=Anopheles dirus TaxID=7168 RepID=A0A182N0T6_9DIPT